MKNYIGGILLLLFICNQTHILAQDNETIKQFLDAEYYLFEGQYQKALPIYLRLLQNDSASVVLNYRTGQCYYHNLREQQKAIPYLRKVESKVSRRFVEKKLDQHVCDIKTLLMLGELYHVQEDLVNALSYYKRYKAKLRSNETDEQTHVKRKIESVYIAYELQKEYLPFSAVNLGPAINTRHSDYNPVISANQDVLIYTSYWETIDLIFYTTKQDGVWKRPINITRMLGSMGDCYTSAMSPDGKTLYLVKQHFYDSDIYVSHLVDNTWTNMERFSNRVNSNSLETSVGLSSDGKTMILSSNRPGGEGGLDLYITSVDEKGDWQKPVNLGNVINTKFDEDAPFLADNDNILFFSSKGHESMGGYDIFYSLKDVNGNWSEPVNVGYPLNTAGNDLFFVPMGRGNEGYFMKDLPGGYGLVDIYKVDIPYHLLFSDKLTDYRQRKDTISNYKKEVETVLVEKKRTDSIAIAKGEIKNEVTVFKNDTVYFTDTKADQAFLQNIEARPQVIDTAPSNRISTNTNTESKPIVGSINNGKNNIEHKHSKTRSAISTGSAVTVAGGAGTIVMAGAVKPTPALTGGGKGAVLQPKTQSSALQHEDKTVPSADNQLALQTNNQSPIEQVGKDTRDNEQKTSVFYADNNATPTNTITTGVSKDTQITSSLPEVTSNSPRNSLPAKSSASTAGNTANIASKETVSGNITEQSVLENVIQEKSEHKSTQGTYTSDTKTDKISHINTALENGNTTNTKTTSSLGSAENRHDFNTSHTGTIVTSQQPSSGQHNTPESQQEDASDLTQQINRMDYLNSGSSTINTTITNSKEDYAPDKEPVIIDNRTTTKHPYAYNQQLNIQSSNADEVTKYALENSESLPSQLPVTEKIQLVPSHPSKEQIHQQQEAPNNLSNDKTTLKQEETSPAKAAASVKEQATPIAALNLSQAQRAYTNVYTIQIKALLHPVPASYFKNINGLVVSLGNDAFTRYTYGEFRGYSKAKAELHRIRKLGYPDAFIRTVTSVSNYNN